MRSMRCALLAPKIDIDQILFDDNQSCGVKKDDNLPCAESGAG